MKATIKTLAAAASLLLLPAALVTSALAIEYDPIPEDDLLAQAQAANVVVQIPPFIGSHLYIPNDGLSKHPGIITLHGADGGDTGYVDWRVAIPLAERGYTVLALDYYHTPGLPKKLAKIQVELVFKALDWLKKSGLIHGKPGLYGESYGAMFALVVGAIDRGKKFSSIGVLAAHATTWPGYDLATGLWATDSKGQNLPAFTYLRKPIAMFKPIESWRFPGPILLVHGRKDRIWSYTESVTLQKEAKKRGKMNHTVLLLAGEGHVPGSSAGTETLRNRLAKHFRKPTKP